MRGRFLLSVLAPCALAVMAFDARQSTQTPNPLGGDAAAIAGGRELYGQICQSCHGPGGQGSDRGPTLATSALVHGNADPDLFQTIRHGLPGTQMAGFAALADRDIWRIVAYLRTLQASASTTAASPAVAASTAASASAATATSASAAAASPFAASSSASAACAASGSSASRRQPSSVFHPISRCRVVPDLGSRLRHWQRAPHRGSEALGTCRQRPRHQDALLYARPGGAARHGDQLPAQEPRRGATGRAFRRRPM